MNVSLRRFRQRLSTSRYQAEPLEPRRLLALPTVIEGPIVNPANGHSYYLLSSANWTESQAAAQQLGGDLVTINDAAENDWVSDRFAATNRDLWIGLTDAATEGTFVWASGSTAAYRNWAVGEPNNQGDEDFATIYGLRGQGSRQWNDRPDAPAAVQNGVVEIVVPSPVWQQTRKLPAPEGIRGDQFFGTSVSLNGDLALVGRPSYVRKVSGSSSNNARGSAHVIHRVSGALLADLAAEDSEAGDNFGYSVFLSGNIALIGSVHDGDNGFLSGSAYLFDVTTGVQLAKIKPADGAPGDRFGTSVALSGNIALVGSPYDNSGSVYLFDVTTGVQIAKLKPTDGHSGDEFGTSIAVNGSTVLVGSPYDDDNGGASGSAYLFDVITGAQIAKLKAVDGSEGDRFGTSVALNGRRALIGSPLNSYNGNSSGSAYLFDAITGVQRAKLNPVDGAAGDLFGYSVALSSDIALVGSYGDDDNGNASGSAYLLNASTGTQIAKLKPSDGAAGDLFGISVALSGSTALVGSPKDDNGFYFGLAYLFNTAAGPADLIVDDVVAGSVSVTSGGTLPVSFRIRNTGQPGVGPSKARLRLSLDQNLTLYDLPLSPLDVSIPAIAANGYYDFTGTVTVPPGTPPGDYYVGVFADALDQTNQSDRTNDAGLSATKITVTAIGLAPVIDQHPQSHNVPQGGSVDLSVIATLPGGRSTDALRYVWSRNGRPLSDPNGSSSPTLLIRNASLQQAGSYSVSVFAPGGRFVTSQPASVAVSTVPTTARPPDNGKLVPIGNFDTNRPTVILTHGWEGNHEFPWLNEQGQPRLDPYAFALNHSNDEQGEWVSDFDWFASLVSNRVGNQANLYVFVWSGAFTGPDLLGDTYDVVDAAGRAPDAGRVLSSEMRRTLGPMYRQAVHFIAHSAGTLVNAHAVNDLEEHGWNNGAAPMQFTLLDAPLSFGPFYDDETYFQELLPAAGTPYGIDWVDNYWGDDGNAIGQPLNGASAGAPPAAIDGGYLVPNADHSHVRTWYMDTVAPDNQTFGFDYSVALNGLWNSRPQPLWTAPEPTVPPLYETTPMTLGIGGEPGWQAPFGTAQGGSSNVFGQTVPTLTLTPSPPSLRGGEASRAMLTLDMQLADHVSTLEFDYQVIQPTADVRIVVTFNNTTLYEFGVDATSPAGFRHAALPISVHAGEVGVLSVSIVGPAGTTSRLTIANVRTADLIAPAVAGAFEFETAQQFRLTFDESVGGSLSLADLTLIDIATGIAVPVAGLSLVVAPDGKSATVSRAGAPLSNGRYRLTLAEGSVEDAAGNTLPTDVEFEFDVLAGDANRDGTVGFADLVILAQNYNAGPRTFSQGNFDYSADGVVGFSDLVILAQNYNRSLALAAAVGLPGGASGRLDGTLSGALGGVAADVLGVEGDGRKGGRRGVGR